MFPFSNIQKIHPRFQGLEIQEEDWKYLILKLVRQDRFISNTIGCSIKVVGAMVSLKSHSGIGITRHIAAAWQNERGNIGNWSEILSAVKPVFP